MPMKIISSFITKPKVLPVLSKKAKKVSFSPTRLSINDRTPKKKIIKPISDKWLFFMEQYYMAQNRILMFLKTKMRILYFI